MNKKFKMSVATSFALLLLTACGQAPNVVEPSTSTTNNTVSSTVDVQSIGQLKFTKVSNEKAAQYNGMINQTASSNASGGSGTADSAAPVAPTVSAMGGAIASDAKMAPSMMYFPYPGAFEEYAVTDFEEAKTNGFTGTYLEALNKVVKPIILALGSDARLVNSSGSADANGTNTVQTTANTDGKDIATGYPGYYNPYQWQFTYSSASKKQVYNISISSNETLVLKQTWGLKDLNPTDLKVDSKQAIDVITKAILDKNYTSPDANANQYVSPEAQFLYEIPKDSSWYLYLEKEKGNLIWNVSLNINYNYNVMPVAIDATAASGGSATTTIAPSMPPIPEYWYSGGYARIDASTGAIISLTRPAKYKNVVQPYPYPVSVGSNVADAVTPEAEPPCCKE